MKATNKLPLLLALALLMLTARAQQAPNVAEKNSQLIKGILQTVNSQHYSPKVLDDVFSQVLWKNTLEATDPLGQLFMRSDLEKLGKFKTRLDEELSGSIRPGFLSTLSEIYLLRLPEMERDYLEALAQPQNFSIKEDTGPSGGEKTGLARNAAEIRQIRRKRIKYLVLQQYYLLSVQNPQTPDKSALETKARETVALRIKRSLESMRLAADPDKQFDAYLDRMLKVIDPHSSYLSARAEREFADQMSTRFGGIGIQLDPQPQASGIRISGVDVSGSAYKSGKVQIGDIIQAIAEGEEGEMREVAGMGSAELAGLIRGQAGTELRIRLAKAEAATQIIKLTRSAATEGSSQVRSAVISHNGQRMGYIAFPYFYESLDPLTGRHCASDLEQAIVELQNQKISGLIIDLRGNGGGSLREAVRMATLFVGQQPIVQIKDNSGRIISRTALDPDMMMQSGKPFFQQVYTGPLTVMIDERSASASEIFAAAIQDYRRGIIIGSSSSFGKGTVQKLLKLSAPLEGSLQLTYAQFYRANGSSTQLQGVSSDITVPDLDEHAGMREQDLPGPLAWDMVSPVMPEPASGELMRSVIARGKARIAAKSDFAVIAERSKQIAMLKKSRVSLEFTGYSRLAERLAELSKPAPSGTDPQKITISPSAQSTAQNTPLLNRLSSDEVIIQALHTLAELAAG